MAFEQRPNSGALFPNDRKAEEKHPDVKGTVKVECPHCKGTYQLRVSGWFRQSDRGDWTSLAFSPFEAGPKKDAPKGYTPPPARPPPAAAQPKQAPQPEQAEPDEDDVPF